MSSEVEEDFEEYEEEAEEQTEDQSEEPEDPNEEVLRLELSETPFEELLKLKDKLGTKVYNETIATKIDKSFAKNQKKTNECYKRANKNRPQEISSKKVAKHLREVFPMKKSRDERRDPRFDEQCGQYSQNVFNKTYGFLNDIRDKELNELQKMLKKTKNEEKRQELNYLLQRIKNQKISEEMKQKSKEIETKVRNQLNEELNTKNNFVNKSTLNA